MKITHIDLDLVSPTGYTEFVLSCEPEDGVLDIHDPIESLAKLLDEELWHKDGEEYDDVGETDSLVKTLRSGRITKWNENEHGVAVNIDDKEGYYTFMFSIDRKRCDGNPKHCDEVIFGSIQGPMKDNNGNDWYTFLYHHVPDHNHPHASVIERGASDGTTETDEDGDEYLVKYAEEDVPAECQQLVDDLDEYCSECHLRAPISNSNLP